MSEYFPIAFAITCLFGGGYLMLLSFKIYKPKNQTPEQNHRMEVWHIKFGTLSKIVGTILFIYGVYFFIFEKEEEWTPQFRQSVYNDLRTSKTISRFPQFADEACNCMTDSIISKMTETEYRRAMTREPVERFQIIQPYITNCIDTFNKRVRGLDTTRRTRPN